MTQFIVGVSTWIQLRLWQLRTQGNLLKPTLGFGNQPFPIQRGLSRFKQSLPMIWLLGIHGQVVDEVQGQIDKWITENLVVGEFSKGFKAWAMESILGSRIKLQLTWFHTAKEVKAEFQGFIRYLSVAVQFMTELENRSIIIQAPIKGEYVL